MDMKAYKVVAAVLLASLGIASISTERAEAFGWYHSNDPVRVDHCYRGPAYDYMAAYYSSRRPYAAGGCYQHYRVYSHRSRTSRVRVTPLK